MPVTRKLQQEKHDHHSLATSRLSSSPSPSRLSQNSSDSTGLKSSSSVTTVDVDDHNSVMMKQTRRNVSTGVISELLSTSEASQRTASPENSSRRISGRIRKPTAKAQALDSNKTITFPATDASSEGAQADLVIEQEPADKHRQSAEIDGDEEGDTVVVATIENDEPLKSTEHEIFVESPEPRTSQRERKPTIKVLEASNAATSDEDADSSVPSKNLTSKKRSASPQFGDRPQKIVKLTYNPVKVPSKLRFSLSTYDIGSDKTYLPRPSETLPASTATITEQLESSNKSKATRKRRTAKTTRNAVKHSTEIGAESDDVARSEVRTVDGQEDNHRKCDLSCLSPSTKLYVIAKIAAESSDSDEALIGKDSTFSSIFDLWLERARNRFCECNKTEHAHKSRATSCELIEALRPNTVAEVVQPSMSLNSSSSLQRVYASPNFIASRDTNQPRLSLFGWEQTRPLPLQSLRSSPIKQTGFWRTPKSFTSDTANPAGSAQHTLQPNPIKRTYEERIREEFNILTQLRTECFRRGIPIRYDMTNDHLKSLIIRHDSQKTQINGNSQDLNRTILPRQSTFPGTPAPGKLFNRSNSTMSAVPNLPQYHLRQPQSTTSPPTLTSGKDVGAPATDGPQNRLQKARVPGLEAGKVQQTGDDQKPTQIDSLVTPVDASSKIRQKPTASTKRGIRSRRVPMNETPPGPSRTGGMTASISPS